MKKLTKYLMFLCIFLSVNFQNISADPLAMEDLIDSVDATYRGYCHEHVDVLIENECNYWDEFHAVGITGYGSHNSMVTTGYSSNNPCGDVWDADTLKDGSSIVIFVSDSGVYSVDATIRKVWHPEYPKTSYCIDSVLINPISTKIKDGYRIHSDREGTIWVATKRGISYLKNGSDSWNSLFYGAELPNERIEDIISDKNNRIMVVTTKGAYTIKNDVVEMQYALTLSDNDSISYGCFDTKNNLLVATNYGVYYLENDGFKLIEFFNASNIYEALRDTTPSLFNTYKKQDIRKFIFIDEKTEMIYLLGYSVDEYSFIKLQDIKSEPICEKTPNYDWIGGTTRVNKGFTILYVNNLIIRMYDDLVLVENILDGEYLKFDYIVDQWEDNKRYNWGDEYHHDDWTTKKENLLYVEYLKKYDGAIKINRKCLVNDSLMFILSSDGSFRVTANDKESNDVSIEETEETNSEKIIIYPNPVSDIITIKSSIKGNTFIATKEGNLIKEIKNETANIKDLPKGVYFGVIKSNGKIKGVKSFYKK